MTTLFFLDLRFWLFFGLLSWAVMWLCDTVTKKKLFFKRYFVKERGLPAFFLCIFLMPIAFLGGIAALIQWMRNPKTA